MSNTDVSWRWDLVVFRLCNQNPTLSQRQIDVKYWRQPDFHFQPKCNVWLTSCPTSTWRYIDAWCLLGHHKIFYRISIIQTLSSDIYSDWRSQMAARSDTAAAPGPKDGAFMSFNVVWSSPNILKWPLTHKEITPKHIYDRQSLLDIDNAYKHQLSPAATEKLRGLCLLLEPDLETAASPTDATRTRQCRKRCERGRKRGKRGGIRARLRANPTRPALPTLMLSNFRSLENKLDLIQLSRSTHHEARGCCVFVFTKTWLNDNIPFNSKG